MPNNFASGKYAIAECDRCGFEYKLSELKNLVIKTKNVSIKVCPTCWEPDQPQLSIGLYPVNDPQAVREPRPDTSYNSSGTSGLQLTPNSAGYPSGGSRIFQWGWYPVGGAAANDEGLTPNDLTSLGEVGTVMFNVAAWSATTSYAQNASVSYSGGFYLAVKANTNHVPTDITYWVAN
jgi:hypothetical protein